jgi:hypothetical protein|tara:strand:- start:209 stop:829 length:621 start_codon:yes stop_codon:yes gene_type:complete
MLKPKKINFYKTPVNKKVIIVFCLLITNIILLTLIDSLEFFFKLEYPEINNKEAILNNLFFYSILVVIIAPFMEEILYRLPLKKTSYTYISIFIGVIYIAIFDLNFVRIVLLLYIIGIVYLLYLKLNPSKYFILLSVFIFTISHIGNYDFQQIKLLNFLELIFLFFPQLIFAIITTSIRIYFSFWYAVFYHILYNALIIISALIFA